MDKCLAFCQALISTNQKFDFNLSMGKDGFNFNNKELTKSSCVKKQKSPSQQRREDRRKEARKQVQLVEDTEKVTETSGNTAFKCNHCDVNCKSGKGLKIHIGKVHKVLKSPEKERSDFLSTSLQLTPVREERQEFCQNCDTPMSPGHQCDNIDEEESSKNENEKSETEITAEESKSSELKCVKECPRYHKPSKKWCYMECDGNQCWCDENCVTHCDLSATCYCDDCAPFTSITPTKKTKK